jgi:hypothetical protein
MTYDEQNAAWHEEQLRDARMLLARVTGILESTKRHVEAGTNLWTSVDQHLLDECKEFQARPYSLKRATPPELRPDYDGVRL